MGCRFEVLTGREAGRVYELPDDATWIAGRGRASDITVDDPLASRSHLKIEVVGGAVTIRDLGSRNGTYHNERRVEEPVVLDDGDRIQLGETVLRFEEVREREESGDRRVVFCSRCYRACGPETFQEGVLEDRRFVCPACLDGRELDPELIPGFEIVGRLGDGKLGPVFRARHLRLAKEVALKVLTPERAVKRSALKRFLREARIGGRLHHPHILEMYDAAVTQEGVYYLSMELVQGGTLEERIEEVGALEPHVVRRVGRQLVRALAYAHEHDVIHRNIRPANVFLDREGDVKLGDFGLARSLGDADESSITKAGEGLGSLFYTAPEQIHDANQADERSDVFGVGAVLYHALTGDPPFHDRTAGKVLRRLASGDLEPVLEKAPLAPEDLAATVERCLAGEPPDRFDDAATLLDALGEPEREVEEGEETGEMTQEMDGHSTWTDDEPPTPDGGAAR